MPTDRTATTWTSAQVLSDVRRKASLPTTSTDWTDAVVLREATDVLWSFAGWALAQAGEGRLLASLDRPVTGALAGAYGQREFTMPPLAVAGTLESVTWTDSTGSTQSRLVRLDHGEEPDWSTVTGTGSPSSYALLGERIRVYPIPNSGGTLRFTYQRRHPELVTDTIASVGTLNAIPVAGTGATTTLSLAVAIAGLAVGDTVDVIGFSYPYAPLVSSAEVTAIAGTNLTVTAPQTTWTNVQDALGARVVRAGQSPYVSMPLELRTCVHEKTAANIMRTLGDLQGSAASEQLATMELSRVMQLLSPRSKRDKPFAINQFSHLRTGMRGWRR